MRLPQKPQPRQAPYFGNSSQFWLNLQADYELRRMDRAGELPKIARWTLLAAALTGTIGKGIMRPSKMEPEVHAAWIDFSGGVISKDDLILRMRILDPVFGKRLGYRQSQRGLR